MSWRMAKVNSLLREEIAKILERDVEFPESVLVSVVRVDAAKDLRTARVFISIFSGNNKSDDVMKKLVSIRSFMRGRIGKVVRFKYTPELTFVEDTAIRDADRIHSLIEQVSGKEDPSSVSGPEEID